jgi:hypothetical protein
MRISPFVAFTLASLSVTGAYAADVRILSLPESVVGTWAPDANACKGSGPEKLSITPKQHSSADASCEIAWITVTASRDGPVYSARSNCARTTGGAKEAPSYFVVSPRPNDKLLVRMPDAGADSEMATYQKCQ